MAMFIRGCGLPKFDDMNGLRELSRVDVRVQSTVSATLAIENRTAHTWKAGRSVGII